MNAHGDGSRFPGRGAFRAIPSESAATATVNRIGYLRDRPGARERPGQEGPREETRALPAAVDGDVLPGDHAGPVRGEE